MVCCKGCATEIVGDVVACDGVCGQFFHSACLKRSSRSSGSTTCAECLDIRPCHVLRLVKQIFESLSADQALIADKIGPLSSGFAGLQLLSDDTNALSAKIDRLTAVAELIESSSGALMERTHALSSRIACMSRSLDDIQAVLAGFDPGSPGPSSILPVVDDLRRSVRQIKGDLGTWSTAVLANSELLGSIATNVKSLTMRNSGSPSPVTSDAVCMVDPSLLPPSVGLVGVDTPVSEPAGDCSSLPPSALSRRVPSLAGSVGADAPVSELGRGSSSRPCDSHRGCSRRAGIRRGAKRRSRAARGGHASGDSASVPAASDVGLGGLSEGPASGAPLPVSGGAPGRSDPVALRPAKLPKCIFISRVHPDTTEMDIVSHISSRAGVPSGMIACRGITPAHGRDGRAFTASFKVFVPEDAFLGVISPDIWPPGCIVREFVRKGRPNPASRSKNSSARSPSITPT